MKEKFYITIGRQLGSGGREIGEKLANRLDIAFYGKELIRIASQESGLGKEFFEKADEKTSYSIFGGLFGLRSSLIDEVYSGYFLSNESLFQIQSDVIRNLAEKESCLFVGRCADYVLQDNPNGLNVFITANMDDRIQRIAKIQQLPENKARELIEKTDKIRAEYYNYYSNKNWGNAASYHLSINSSTLGIDKTASFILRFAETRFGLKKDHAE